MSNNRLKWTPFLGAIALGLMLLSFGFSPNGKMESYRYHLQDHAKLPLEINELPSDYNDLFAGSGNCITCHGDPDLVPSSNANLDANGNDISPVTTWRASLMANASKDPFWRAKVEHEGLVNPELKDEIENVCTTCHAPNGHFNAQHNGALPYTMTDLISDPMGLDGVSCTSCHVMTDQGFGSTFSGQIVYDTNQTAYGPYEQPFTNPMVNMTGFTPTFGNHISQSEQCAKCHTLITQPLDSLGSPIGTSFVEQAVYHEWLNSIYAEEGTSCQNCHMRAIEEPVVVSSMPWWLEARDEFSTHDIVGGNVFMLELIKNNAEALEANASAEQFDAMIAATGEMLQRAVELSVLSLQFENDSMVVGVQIKNKSGHKLPSGYPSRKMYIEFLLVSELAGDTLFHSGQITPEGRIVGEPDQGFESHFDEITQEDQVQIFEMVMGDYYGSPTTVLEYAYAPLKDNRIPPVGFSNTHSAYDTVPIVGQALNDSNFNLSDGAEGSGSDVITYRVPVPDSDPSNNSSLKIAIKVHYLPVPVKWLDEMFELEGDDIDLFRQMYDESETAPELIADTLITLWLTDVDAVPEIEIGLYPNPTTSRVTLKCECEIESLRVFDSNGRLVKNHSDINARHFEFDLPFIKGTYQLHGLTSEGISFSKAIVKS